MKNQVDSTESNNTFMIPVVKTVIFSIVIMYLEQDKYWRKQPLVDSLMDIHFFIGLFILSGRIRITMGYFILLFDIFETFCYRYSHHGINTQIIMAMDFKFIWKNLKILFFLLPLGAFVLYLLVRMKTLDSLEIGINRFIIIWLGVSLVVPFFYLAYRVDQNLNGKNIVILNKQFTYAQLLNFFSTTNVTVKPRKEGRLKNLLIFELESMENQILGRYNKWNPDSMPFVTKMTRNSTFFSKIVPQEYTTWSVASTFAVHCGMPMILPYTNMDGNTLKIHWSPMHHCIGDYLYNAGYKLYSMMTKEFVGGFRKMLELHHWVAQDENDHKFNRDYDVLQLIQNKMLPELAKESNQPFALHIANTDPHPSYPEVHKKCKLRVSRRYNIAMKLYDCYDQALEEFFMKFEQLGLHKNTVVLLYGDHPIMWTKGMKVTEPRYLPAIFPYREVQEINRPITLYDLSHTLFDMLDLDIAPKFPYGSSLLGGVRGSPPSNTDFQVLFNIFKHTFDVNQANNQKVDGFY